MVSDTVKFVGGEGKFCRGKWVEPVDSDGKKCLAFKTNRRVSDGEMDCVKGIIPANSYETVFPLVEYRNDAGSTMILVGLKPVSPVETCDEKIARWKTLQEERRERYLKQAESLARKIPGMDAMTFALDWARRRV